ncbi:hypothetical protein N186_03430 [Thermofilum adornatum]|uniref:Uncharacterized protein n=1 Tax=Thermofilum adornatum TaxID=1365176 RepID=S5ZVC1_9CREN|nr:hypothetical protein N186_03430 [Thermofilum adornatum]
MGVFFSSNSLKAVLKTSKHSLEIVPAGFLHFKNVPYASSWRIEMFLLVLESTTNMSPHPLLKKLTETTSPTKIIFLPKRESLIASMALSTDRGGSS